MVMNGTGSYESASPLRRETPYKSVNGKNGGILMTPPSKLQRASTHACNDFDRSQ